MKILMKWDQCVSKILLRSAALGSEFCSGYMDTTGKWNNGFYCPGESTEEQFCCGTSTFKYCCPQREHVVTEDVSR
jgi:hypothetical protein